MPNRFRKLQPKLPNQMYHGYMYFNSLSTGSESCRVLVDPQTIDPLALAAFAAAIAAPALSPTSFSYASVDF